jgi:zinc transport system substrate-binding protein
MRHLRRYLFMILGFSSLFFIFSCMKTDESTSDLIQISVSILPEKTFVEAVSKDKADVNVVIPPGGSPATYEPTPQEVAKLADADLYLAIGVPTEANNIIPLIDTDTTKLVMLHTQVKEIYPDIILSGTNRDPHIWLSVKRVIVMTRIIADELSLLDPENETFYQDNADAYIAALTTLMNDADTKLASLQNRTFIVFHPAFRYLAEDFNLEMIALEQDGKEATAERIAEMIDFAKAEGIKVIFYQAEFSSVQAQAFAEEIGGQTMMLAPLSPDYINNLKAMIDLFYEVLSNDLS